MIEIIPQPIEQLQEQAQKLNYFLLTVPVWQPISLRILYALAGRFGIEPETLAALISLYGGEVQENGK